MNIQLIEARYQRAVFQGNEEVIKSDFKLRYGDKWEDLWAASVNAGEEDVKNAERSAKELSALVESRIEDIDIASLYAAYGRNLSIEGELDLAMGLLGVNRAVAKLLKWGLVMHFSDDVVTAPAYLARLLIKLSNRAPRIDYDPKWDLENADGSTLAFIEGMLAGDFNEEFHALIYGEVPKSPRLGRFAIYSSASGIVVNPLLSVDEALGLMLDIKRRKADQLSKSLALHGEYEFSREMRCGVHYLSVDGTVEKSGLVAICPWMSYSRKLLRRLQVLVVQGSKPPAAKRAEFGIIYVKGGEAEAIAPLRRSKLFEYLLDLLYSAGFSVSEL